MILSKDSRRVRKTGATLCVLLFCFLSAAAHAQGPAFPVTDSNLQPVTLPSNLPDFRAIGTTTFFVADDGALEPKLWSRDDSAARAVLLNPGSQSRTFFALAGLNGLLIFQVAGDYGVEIWQSNGTIAGTVFLTKPSTATRSARAWRSRTPVSVVPSLAHALARPCVAGARPCRG